MSDPMEPYYGRDPHVVARELATKIAALEAENERLTALFYEADVAFTLVQEGGTYATFVMTVFDIVKRALPMEGGEKRPAPAGQACTCDLRRRLELLLSHHDQEER